MYELSSIETISTQLIDCIVMVNYCCVEYSLLHINVLGIVQWLCERR